MRSSAQQERSTNRRPEEFKVCDSHVARFIRRKTGHSWSRTMKIFHEASKNHVIIFDPSTRLWRGYLHDGKPKGIPMIGKRSHARKNR